MHRYLKIAAIILASATLVIFGYHAHFGNRPLVWRSGPGSDVPSCDGPFVEMAEVFDAFIETFWWFAGQAIGIPSLGACF